MGEKKCPHCGRWSKWNNNLEDNCEHCGKPLGGRDLEYKILREKDVKSNEDQWIFNVKDEDPKVLRTLKTIGNFFFTLYLSIITILAWIIAVLPG